MWMLNMCQRHRAEPGQRGGREEGGGDVGWVYVCFEVRVC